MASSIVAGYESCGLHRKPYPNPSSRAALFWNPFSKLSLSNWQNDPICFSIKKMQTRYRTKRNSFAVYANSVPGAPLPSGPPPNSHSLSWIIGLVISLILPFFTNKWGPLWVIKNRIENAVQRVEDVVEAVEKVAEKVDEIAEDIADDLPQGKLKDLVEMIENVAEKTAKTADSLDNVIDKAQEAEERLEEIVAESLAKMPENSPKEKQN
ncbi:plastid-targeted protein 4 [Striga asiatica]|uniref:Plastid-targeted protein 4 n=1 Tax=Striga asiatica TaxID=4170 RepID=A0A5A7QXR1_STRAF|nr:plastid-targeted protein 4 [Striga asiatica]